MGNYALVEDGVVINMIWLNDSNAAEFLGAMSCEDRPVAIGDTFENGQFLRDGEPILTEDEKQDIEIAEMQTENKRLKTQISAAVDQLEFQEEVITEVILAVMP